MSKRSSEFHRNRVIRYEKESGRFILKENKWVERKIFFFIDILSRSDIRKVLSVI